MKKLNFLSKFLNSIVINYYPEKFSESSKITYLENARITSNSVVLKNWRVMKSSTVYADKDWYNKLGFLAKYIIPNFPFSKKNITYIKITDEWSDGYYHWIFEALSNLTQLQEIYPNSTVILPKKYLQKEYVIKSLEAFGVDKKNTITINRKSNLKVKKLAFIGRVKDVELDFPVDQYYNSLKFSKIRNQIISHFSKDFKTNFGEKIYISRNNPKQNFKRKIANENEVVNLLENHGFKTIYLEDFNFLQQVSITHHAKYIVAAHGAGISNALFMKEGGRVIEIIDSQWNRKNMFFFDCYSEMFKRIGTKHLTHQASSDKDKNLIVDLEKLEKDLSEIEIVK